MSQINATIAASPDTKTALFGGWAADNKGCCSGSKLGIFGKPNISEDAVETGRLDSP